MKTSWRTSMSCSASLSVALSLFATCCFGDPPILRWNGPAAGTNLWNTTALTWLDSDTHAVAWQSGATAQFDGTGGLVDIATDVTVSNIAFSATGYTLLGGGRLTVEGTLSCAEATTNSIAADLLTVGGLSKTGLGALALARCTGPFNVAEGTLLASGSSFIDADLSVASGASLVRFCFSKRDETLAEADRRLATLATLARG